MTSWFRWGEAPEPAQDGDRVWMIGARDQVFSNGLWTLVCPGCDLAMAGRDSAGGLSCVRCGAGFKDIPRREVAP